MVSLHDFDLRSRGIADVVEGWGSPDLAIRSIWNIDDLIGTSIDLVHAANRIREVVRARGNHGASDASAAPTYFNELVRRLQEVISTIETRALILESQNISIGRRAELHDAAELLQEILSENERSAEAAEWDQLDREALTTQDLLDIREYLRESGQASI